MALQFLPAAAGWLVKFLASWAAGEVVQQILKPVPTSKKDTKAEAAKWEKKAATPTVKPQPYVKKLDQQTLEIAPPPSGLPAAKPAPIKVVKGFAAPPPLAPINPDKLISDLWKFKDAVGNAVSGWSNGQALRPTTPELTANNTVQGFRFGQLLGSNHAYGKIQTVHEWTHWVDLTEFKKRHQESHEGFAWWLANQAGEISDKDMLAAAKGDFYDQGALIWPADNRSFNGDVSLLFGARPLADLFADYWCLSQNFDAAGLRGVTYMDITPFQEKFPFPRFYNESGSQSGDPSIDKLANNLGTLLAKGATMLGVTTPVMPAIKLEGASLKNKKPPRPGTPSQCFWTMDRGTVIGNQVGQNAVLDVVTNTQLVNVQTKLGPQVAGGITGWLGRFAKSIYLDKALNFINVMLNVHNAVMLSKNLVVTLGEIQTLIINAIGKQMKNETLENFDVNEAIGKQFKGVIESILGKEQTEELTKKIAKYNRITSAVTNLLNSLESMLFSLSEMMSLAGEYQGKVGNALKRSGAVLEDSYEAMQEKWRMMFGKRFAKIDRVLRGIDKGTEVADNLAGIAGEAAEVPEYLTEIGKARKELYGAVKDGLPERSPGNKPIQQQAATQKEQSASPDIDTSAMIKPEADEG